jgi:DNA-cytosine methyltransferase
MTDLTVVSLFDGIGGFPLAFERAGAKTVATVEIDKPAAAISKRHFPNAVQFDDVTKVTGNDLRAVGFVPQRGIITAGWPCQDLSIAGRRAGLAGERSGLWWEVVRLLSETGSRWFLGENVPGLLSSNGGRDMGAVVGALGELGYGFAYRVLDAQWFGVPQRRRRVFIVGHLGVPFTAAAEVLFELEGGAGHFAAGGEEGQAVAGTSTGGAGEPVSVFNTHTHTLTASASKMVAEDGTGRGCPIVTTAAEDTHTQRSRRCRAAGNAAGGSTPNQQQETTSSSWAVAALTSNGVGTCGADDNQAQAGHLIPTILGGA